MAPRTWCWWTWPGSYNKNVKVFSLDTGRLHPETYRFIEQVREHYGIAIEVMTPDPRLLEPFVKEKGLFSFFKDGHGECCGIRKIEPLKRKLSTVTAWATGQRKDQSPGTRSQVAVVELDGAFSTPEKPLIKFNPLANMSSEEDLGLHPHAGNPLQQPARARLHQHRLRALHPPRAAEQHEREGRWWWEEATQKECGLHAGNLISKA
ncbi:MAG: phosphoadenosine phosphosulfate reductase family protein [Pseudomonas sp.]